MDVTIAEMERSHWDEVRRIYAEGIATGHATFETEVPGWDAWDRDHLPSPRLVALARGRVRGWAAVSPVSGRCVYGGVAEASVYVEATSRGRGVGEALLRRLVVESEKGGLWTLQAGVFPENRGSVRLLEKVGFREVGVREKLGRMDGRWRDVILLERRAPGGAGGTGPPQPAGAGSGTGLRRAWTRVGREVEGFRAGIRDRPVLPTLGVSEIREALAEGFDLERPGDLDEATSRVIGLLRGGSMHVTSPRYFGLFNPSVLEAGIVADALTALYNLQLATRSHAPAAAEMEALALRRFAAALGLPPESVHATFTSGGSEANLSALLAALAHRSPEWAARGNEALPPGPAVYVSADGHHSFLKVVRMAGLGSGGLREVSVTDRGALDPEALERRIREDVAAGGTPLMVAATAGTTGTGVVDPLPEIAEVAAASGAWFHVDAAWGGAAVLSRRLRPLLDGIEGADSVTWDAHKWLSVPMGAGMFFCRHPEAVRTAFHVATGYMPVASEGGADGYLSTAQWSRRAIGLKVFMSLAQVGRRGYAVLVDHQVEMGERLRAKLREAGWILVNETRLPVVCFTHPEIRNGVRTPGRILEEVYRRGRVWLSEIALGSGERALRACITSYQTEVGDLDVLLEELERARTVPARGGTVPGRTA